MGFLLERVGQARTIFGPASGTSWGLASAASRVEKAIRFMSVHKSLATGGRLVRPRSVMTRYERILELRKTGKWDEANGSPYGLPKVRVLKIKKRGKDKKKKEED